MSLELQSSLLLYLIKILNIFISYDRKDIEEHLQVCLTQYNIYSHRALEQGAVIKR